MDQKLLLKQKDYQLLATKRVLHEKHSFQDPLINPPKQKSKRPKGLPANVPLKNNNNNSSKVLFNDVLQRRTTKAIKIPAAIDQKMPIQEQAEAKYQATPWKAILNFFLKAYDYRKEPTDLQVANPFGSQGLKMEDQHRMSQSAAQLNNLQKEPKTTISMRSYMKILENMKHQLRKKWKDNDKVGSLQITIQACKLLHDTSNAKFHALKFAYVLEIVQQFGLSVFKRIKSLSFPQYSEEKINELSIKDLQGTNIPQSAQQICRNWLLKISSIRQLIPRTIVQTTLLRLHFFLDNGVKARKVLYRLAKSNRCFGQYINCIFFCTFLIRMGREVLPLDKDYILDILDDVFFYIKQGKTKFCRQDIAYDDFFIVLQPFFISSFQSLAQSLSRDKFKRFCSILPQNPHPIILINFIQSFSSSLLIDYSIDIVKMLQKVQGDNKYAIYKKLFQRLSGMLFAQSGQFIILAWTDLTEITNIQILLDLLGPFSNIIFKNLSRYQKNKFYALILQKFSGLFDNIRNLKPSVFTSLSNFLTQIFQKTEDISDILTLQPFLHVIVYLPTVFKGQLSFNISEAFVNRDQAKITDPVVVHIIMGLMKNVPDDKISKLALKFLQKIDLGNDLEQTLSFFGQMRANFGYIEKVTQLLIYKAAGLTYLARKINKGRITNKLISFLQATLSFCYITIPVLQNNQLKLKLYIYLAEVALSNNLISQATSLIKTCITELAEVESQSDRQIYDIFYRIVCFLIVMPDDPQNEYLFLFNGLFQAFLKAKFKTNYQYILKLQFFTKSIVYLSCQAQQRLPFHLQGVTSNDALFKSIDFRRALVQKIMQLADLIEETIPKIATINGTTQIDTYLLSHLTQVVMTLLTTFQGGPRLKKIIKSIIDIIQKSKERLLSRQQKGVQGYYRTCLKGLNQKLTESQMNIRLSF